MDPPIVGGIGQPSRLNMMDTMQAVAAETNATPDC